MTVVDWSELIEILRNSVYITGLVIIMMLVIEYINVATHGHRFTSLKQSPVKQVLVGAALGLIPGCMGGFAAVSLFSHNIFGFGGLLAAMISDTGDETFIMFASIPEQALYIKLLTFALAIGVGLIVNMFISKKKTEHKHFDHDLEIHSDCGGKKEKATSNILYNIRHLSTYRVLILSGIFLFMFALGFGLLEHDHAAHEHGIELHECEHDHDHLCEHNHGHEHGNGDIFSERWINILFLFVAMTAFIMVLSVSEHFLKEHIFSHIIRKHVFRVFIWTFGSLMFIYLLGLFVHYDKWIDDNLIVMLLIALTIGLIPQSGPHIVFISLFINGNIPFSILLANSIVQNGHSGLPLLAESKKGFITTKALALLVGLAVGLTGYFMGW